MQQQSSSDEQAELKEEGGEEEEAAAEGADEVGACERRSSSFMLAPPGAGVCIYKSRSRDIACCVSRSVFRLAGVRGGALGVSRQAAEIGKLSECWSLRGS